MNKGITLWLKYKDGHMERKWFSSSIKAVAWLEKHDDVVSASQVLN